MGRATILSLMAAGAILFIVLIAFVNKDHQGAQQEKRNENLRLARIANGLPEEEIDKTSEKLPKAVVPETVFEFGALAAEDSFTHSFEIRNEGKATLELHVDKPSCTCVVAKSVKRAIAPGEKTTLELGFKPDGKTGNVMQGVRVRTNDPYRKEIAFQIIGQTKQVYWLDQSDIAFTDLQPEEEREVERNIFSSYEDGFEILDVKTEPQNLVLNIESLSPEKIAAEKNAKSGKKLIVSCPKEMSEFAGSFVTFVVRHGANDDGVSYHLNVGGSRLGRIGIYGQPLDSMGKMKFGQLLVGEGKKAVYAMKVRGSERELKVKEIRTQPPGVLVSIEPVGEDAAKTGQYRFIVEVPKDLPEQSHMGKNAGKIEIEFENPLHKKLEFQLHFSIVLAKSIE